MNKIKPKSSPGPDGFPPHLVKKISRSLAYPLSAIYTSFMSVGKVPLEWKRAFVTPIFKGGLASDPSNYRPVSLTSIFSKIMERVVVVELLDYCRKHGLISRQQHGFLSKRSTVTNLLECTNDWTFALMNHRSVITAYIDFKKAFDSVCHAKLFSRLESLGICGNLLDWLRTLLTGRTQCTRVGSAMSSSIDIISGVIQGSCIGPLLFVLFINSLTKQLGSDVKCVLYADDAKLYSVVNTDSDCTNLQKGLDSIALWAKDNQLPISIKKCAVIVFGNVNVMQPFNIDGQNIDFVQETKDLGVTVDPTLKFNVHINRVVNKARSRAYLIRKCFVSRDPQLLLRAFTVYVRPLLEYASSVWSPCYNYAIDKLESVQRRFTKQFPGLENMDYSSRLTALNLPSLERRRLEADLILTYKIIFGIVDVDASIYFKLRDDNSIMTRGNKYKLVSNLCRTVQRQNFFSERVINVWNSLPPCLVNFSSRSAFKSTLFKAKLRIFTKY